MAASIAWCTEKLARTTWKSSRPSRTGNCVRKLGGQTRRGNNDQKEAEMAIAPVLRTPQGCVAPLPGAAHPPLPRARQALRRGGLGEETGWGEVPSSSARQTLEGSAVR